MSFFRAGILLVPRLDFEILSGLEVGYWQGTLILSECNHRLD